MSLSVALMAGPFAKGLATSAGLIMAIGAQNAFVLTQGVKREFHWPVAGLCSLLDTLLIMLGIAGMGALISQSPQLLAVATWGGALFLFWYGARALRAVLNPDVLKVHGKGFSSLRAALLATLALSLLNPHVYLDTVVLLGSIGGSYPPEARFKFGAGAALFSFVWFFSLSLGARWLAPLFTRPAAWRVLDGLVWLMMWGLALGLVLGAI